MALSPDQLVGLELANGKKKGVDLAEGLFLVGGELRPYTVATVSTTDNTDTTAASITLADGDVVLVVARVMAKRTNSSDRATYIRRALFYRDGGGAVRQGNVDTILTRESSAQWDVDLDTSGNDARVRVKGAIGHDVDWTVRYETFTVT